MTEFDGGGGVQCIQSSAFWTVIVVILADMDLFILCVIALLTKIEDVLAS